MGNSPIKQAQPAQPAQRNLEFPGLDTIKNRFAIKKESMENIIHTHSKLCNKSYLVGCDKSLEHIYFVLDGHEVTMPLSEPQQFLESLTNVERMNEEEFKQLAKDQEWHFVD